MSTELKTLNGYGFDATKLGGLDAQYYAQGRAAHNLLDNSNFRNPVNQRGITSTGDVGYNIDRWKKENASGTVTIGNNYIAMTGTGAYWFLTQFVPTNKIKSGAVYTIALSDTSGSVGVCSTVMSTDMTKFTARHTFTSGAVVAINVEYTSDKYAVYFTSNSSAETRFAWAALYEGSYTADTLPAYQPKGYAAELAECQRYYYAVENELLFSAWADTNGCLDYTVLLPQTMRAIPTVTFDKLQYIDESGYVSFTNSPYYTGRDRVAIRKLSLTLNKAYGLSVKFSASADL